MSKERRINEDWEIWNGPMNLHRGDFMGKQYLDRWEKRINVLFGSKTIPANVRGQNIKFKENNFIKRVIKNFIEKILKLTLLHHFNSK